MNTEQESFEKALLENRYDQETHFVYADWLYEQGEDDLADWHITWTKERQESEDWMRDFASKCGKTCTNYGQVWDEYYNKSETLTEEQKDNWQDQEVWKYITYEDVLQAGIDFVKSDGEDYFVQQGSEEARSLMEKHHDAYWKHWSVLTGQPVPDWTKDVYKWASTAPFSCSC